jgi:hypothetical protein
MYPAAVLLTQRRLEISDCAGSPQEARRGLVHRYRIVWRCKAFRRRWWCCEEGRCGCGKRRRATGSHGASTAVFHDDTLTRQTTSSSPFPPFPFVPFVVRASLAPARGSLVWVGSGLAAPLPGLDPVERILERHFVFLKSDHAVFARRLDAPQRIAK